MAGSQENVYVCICLRTQTFRCTEKWECSQLVSKLRTLQAISYKRINCSQVKPWTVCGWLLHVFSPRNLSLPWLLAILQECLGDYHTIIWHPQYVNAINVIYFCGSTVNMCNRSALLSKDLLASHTPRDKV